MKKKKNLQVDERKARGEERRSRHQLSWARKWKVRPRLLIHYCTFLEASAETRVTVLVLVPIPVYSVLYTFLNQLSSHLVSSRYRSDA